MVILGATTPFAIERVSEPKLHLEEEGGVCRDGRVLFDSDSAMDLKKSRKKLENIYLLSKD